MELDVYNEQGERVGTVELDDAIVQEGIRYRLLAQVIRMYEARLRRGTRSTKTRGERRGGNRKPWRQKGTGRARHGSRRSPIWRKGGIVFGPRPQDFSYSLPRKALKVALRSALCGKILDGEVKVLEDVSFDEPKTKRAQALLEALDVADAKTLVVPAESDRTLYLSFRNIPKANVLPLRQLNAYELLKTRYVVFYRSAVERLSEFARA